MTDLDVIRARHVRLGDAYGGVESGTADYPVCKFEDEAWPCDTAVVLAALDGSEAHRKRLDAAITKAEKAERLPKRQNLDYWRSLLADAERERDAAIERERRLRAVLGDLRTAGVTLPESLTDVLVTSEEPEAETP